MPEQRGQRESAGAGGHGVDAIGTGYFPCHGDGLLAGREIGLDVPVALRGGGVAPADAERLHPVLHRELGEAASGGKIGRVELVDLRRHDEQRPPLHEISLWRVLDELEHLAAVHDGAGRGGEVPAHLELALVHLARHAEIVGEIVDEILQPVEQALAARFGDALQGARIPEQGIGRRERLGEQLQYEARAFAVFRGGLGAVEHAVEHVAPGDESLHEPLVVAALLPDDMGETAVARIRRDLRAPHGHVEELARKGDVLFDQHLRIDGHEPQQPFAGG